MFSPIVIAIAVFGFVCTVVAAIALLAGGKSSTELENRLDFLTAAGNKGSKKQIGEEDTPTLLSQPLGEKRTFAESLFSHFGDLRKMLDQAGLKMSPTQFL